MRMPNGFNPKNGQRLILTPAATLALAAAALAQPQVLINPPSRLSYLTDPDKGDHSHPEITTDGQGNWIAVWESSQTLDPSIGDDRDILFSRSINNGIAWTFPAPLNTNAQTDQEDDYTPQITTDAQGNWIAVWFSREDLDQKINTDPDILFARSTDNGATWSAPQPLNTNAGSDPAFDFFPQITTDARGNWMAVWQSSIPLDPIGGGDWDIYFATSTDNGQTWTAPEFLNTNPAMDPVQDTSPQLTTDARGTWIAAWEASGDFNGNLLVDSEIRFTRSTDNGQTWTLPAPIDARPSPNSKIEQNVHLATDGDRHWVAVWNALSQVTGPDVDILVSRSADRGRTWSPPEFLNTNAQTDAGEDNHPRVTTDGIGTWIAVWESDEKSVLPGLEVVASGLNLPPVYDPGSTQISEDIGPSKNPDLIGTDDDVLMAVSTDNGQTWTAPRSLNTDADEDFPQDRDPRLAADGIGNWVAVWQTRKEIDPAKDDLDNIATARFEYFLTNNTGQANPQNFCGAGAATATPFLMIGLSLIRTTTRRTLPPGTKRA